MELLMNSFRSVNYIQKKKILMKNLKPKQFSILSEKSFTNFKRY